MSRLLYLDKQLLNRIKIGKMKLEDATDYALPILLDKSVNCEEYEIARLIQNEIDTRKK